MISISKYLKFCLGNNTNYIMEENKLPEINAKINFYIKLKIFKLQFNFMKFQIHVVTADESYN